MDIQVTKRHVEVAADLQETVTDKLQRLQRFYEKITSCHVIFGAEHNDKSTEIVATIMGTTLTARGKADNFGAATESALDKLERQLKKSNEKVKNHKSVKPE
jgi:putative sigma-54 modulation protein